jgi:hypothetical protein
MKYTTNSIIILPYKMNTLNNPLKSLLLSNTLLKRTLYPVHKRHLFGAIGNMFAKRGEFKKEQAKFGKDRDDAYRAEYEKEIQERTKNKMNWNIKNRWEQRALDDVIKNVDVRSIRFRDYAKIQQQ